MRTTWAQRCIEAGVLFLLVFTPLAYGAVELWSEALVELVVLAMAVAYVIGSLRDWELRIELPPGWLPGMLFLVLVILQAVVPGWSVDPHATWRMTLKLLAVAAFYLVCWNTYLTSEQCRRAIGVMVVMGTLLAVFGIVQRMIWNGHLYWIGREAPSTAFGPFVNRTHFAGLMVTVVPVALAFVLTGSRREIRRTRRRRVSWADRLREWNSQNANASTLVGFFVLVMGGAALVSGSRGGLLALLAALAAMGLGSLSGERYWSGRAARLGFITLLVIAGGAWISSEAFFGTVDRLAQELARPDESARIRIWTDALALWRSVPVSGSGLATFGVAFPRFRTLEAPVTFTHAESDWVQLLMDTGLLGISFTLGVVAFAVITMARRRRRATTRTGRLFALAGLVALSGSVVQSIGNYNLPVMSSLLYLTIAVVLAGHWHDAQSIATPVHVEERR